MATLAQFLAGFGFGSVAGLLAVLTVPRFFPVD